MKRRRDCARSGLRSGASIKESALAFVARFSRDSHPGLIHKRVHCTGKGALLSTDEIRGEQGYVSMLYGRLDSLRSRASDRLAQVLREAGGTHQARSEREAFGAMYAQQLSHFHTAANGLCFGRLDFHDGERRYIGRIGIHGESGDYEQLLMDWRASAARPFYLATAASPAAPPRRRPLKTPGRAAGAVGDQVSDLAATRPRNPQAA